LIVENNYSLQEILSGAARAGQPPAQPGNNNGGGVNRMLAICFVPVQEWEQPYDEDTAYSAGTMFPSLNKPFLGGGR